MEAFPGMMWAGRMRGGVPLVVLAGSGRQHAGGLGRTPRVGGGVEAAALRSLWIFASTSITFHSKQLAHNGYSGARSPLDRTRRSQFSPARVPQDDKEAGIHLTEGRTSRCDEARSCGGTRGCHQHTVRWMVRNLKTFPL